MISNDKEIISLWLGEESRNHAFAFYNLQAEQIYDEEEDPVQQSCIWKNIDKKNPRMIIFDTIIDRLTAIRQINHKKLLKKM